MSRDTILTAEDGTRYSLDNLSTQKWLEGHESGLDACVAWLRQRSADMFASDDDEAASETKKLAREMAAALRPGMVERAEQHAREFPDLVETE